MIQNVARRARCIRLNNGAAFKNLQSRSIVVARILKPIISQTSVAPNGSCWRLTPAVLSNVRSFSDLPSHVTLPMPALSPTMETGTIANWHVSEGSVVEAGTVLCEVETDKATVDFESQEEGYIAKILVSAGTPDVPVGAPVAIMVEDEADVAAFANYTAPAAPAATPSSPAPPPPAPAAPAPTPTPAATPAPPAPAAAPAAAPASGERVFASPLARRVAREMGIDIAQVPPTGPYSRIVQADVLSFQPAAAAAAEAAAAAPIAAAAAAGAQSTLVAVGGGLYRDILTSEQQQSLAARLTQSRTDVPHYHLTVELELSALLSVRAELNQSASDDAQLSVNDLLLKAAAAALRAVPDVNASWLGTSIRQYDYVDLSLVVGAAAEGGEGGFVTAQPVLRDAHAKGLSAIARESRELVARAAEGALGAEETLGGTFTVCNLGSYGVKQFTGIITPPQAAVLSLGGIDQTVIPDDSSEQGYRVAPVMTATLSCDHRVIDGAVGAEWLAAYKQLVANPLRLLL